MKIGILTFHAVCNFGANLQALSTVCYLKNAGHDPFVIDFFPLSLEEAFQKSTPKEQFEAHDLFVKKHFKLTERCRNSEEVAKQIVINKIEAVIIGSDAVVQHYPLLSRIKVGFSRKTLLKIQIKPIQYEMNFPNPFWGDFLKYLKVKVPVAMMSVSCQNTDYKIIRGGVRNSIHKSIIPLNYISVRDLRTKQFFQHVSCFRISPTITPDPVFAFNYNFKQHPTKQEIIFKFDLPEKYILISFHSAKIVNKHWLTEFEKISNEYGYTCVALTTSKGVGFDSLFNKIVNIPLDPIYWYFLIKYSSAYVGDNMHPIIVSLHNRVPFFSFDHYGILRFNLFTNHKSSKIYQLLKRSNFLGLRVSIKRQIFYNPPSPQFVFNRLITFDTNECLDFSNEMYSEYLNMMDNILVSFGNK